MVLDWHKLCCWENQMSDTPEEVNSYKKIKRVSDEELQEIWFKYFEDRKNKELRDKLIVQYLYLARYVVNRIKSSLPQEFTLEDITSFGVEGLIIAIERYAPKRGAKFETYALTKIRGNIIDNIREQDFIPRGIRKRLKELKAVAEEIKAQTGKLPTPTELGNAVGLSAEKVLEIFADDPVFLSIYEKKGVGEDSVEIIDTIVDEGTKMPLESLEEKDTQKALQQALNKLPEREKNILVLYYHENMTFKEIGELLNVSESRACQLHSLGIMKLRKFLAESRSERLSKAIV